MLHYQISIPKESFGTRCSGRVFELLWVKFTYEEGLELESELKTGEIERVVRRLTVDEEGEGMRKRGKNLKVKVEFCTKRGSSSDNSLNELVMSF
jgi:hypothetical protein